MGLGREYPYPCQRASLTPSQSPPPLDVNTTDSLLLHVHNSLDQPTTLHHHGMFFNSTSYFDGAQGVSEWLVHFVCWSRVLSSLPLTVEFLPVVTLTT